MNLPAKLFSGVPGAVLVISWPKSLTANSAAARKPLILLVFPLFHYSTSAVFFSNFHRFFECRISRQLARVGNSLGGLMFIFLWVCPQKLAFARVQTGLLSPLPCFRFGKIRQRLSIEIRVGQRSPNALFYVYQNRSTAFRFIRLAVLPFLIWIHQYQAFLFPLTEVKLPGEGGTKKRCKPRKRLAAVLSGVPERI